MRYFTPRKVVFFSWLHDLAWWRVRLAVRPKLFDKNHFCFNHEYVLQKLGKIRMRNISQPLHTFHSNTDIYFLSEIRTVRLSKTYFNELKFVWKRLWQITSNEWKGIVSKPFWIKFNPYMINFRRDKRIGKIMAQLLNFPMIFCPKNCGGLVSIEFQLKWRSIWHASMAI